MQRRHFIALASAFAAAAASNGAQAFRLMTPDGRTRNLMQNACSPQGRGDSQYHAQLIAELRGALEANGLMVDRAAYERLIAAAACPLCGCRLSAGLNFPLPPQG